MSKKQENLLYWSIALILAVLILFLAINRFYSNEPTEYEIVNYNNWEFTKIADTWWFEWQKDGNLFTVPLRFNPFEAENIPIKGKLDNELFNTGKNVYVTFDLSENSGQDLTILALAATELTQNMATAIKRNPVAACTNNESDACIDRPIKSCENTNDPVIFLKEGGESSITLSSSCITIEGERFELVKTVDRLLYQWYGIIK